MYVAKYDDNKPSSYMADTMWQNIEESSHAQGKTGLCQILYWFSAPLKNNASSRSYKTKSTLGRLSRRRKGTADCFLNISLAKQLH